MSVTSHPKMTVDRKSHRLPGSLISLVVLLGLLALGAIQGGVAMVTDPTQPLGMPTRYLEATPIDDYFLPGLFLLGIALASLVAIAGLVFDWRWGWACSIERAIGFRWPWVGAVAIGSILLVFEILELFLVPFHPIMHPLLIVGSLAILGLALTKSARAHLSIDR